MPSVNPVRGSGLQPVRRTPPSPGPARNPSTTGRSGHPRRAAWRPVCRSQPPGPASRPCPDTAVRRVHRVPWSAPAPRSQRTVSGSTASKCFCIERTKQADLQHTDLLARCLQCFRRWSGPFRAPVPIATTTRSGVRRAVEVERMILPPGQRGEPVHVLLHDPGQRRVERVYRLPRLEERVRVVRRAAHERMFRVQRPGPMRSHQIVVDHRADLLVGQQLDRVQLVRGAEAVEEMQHGHARFQRHRLGDQRHVMRFLHAGGAQQGEAGGAHRHDVGMVAEDRQRLGGQRAGGDMEHRRRQLAGDLEHVRQHQQQALRRGERRGQRAGLQRAMHRAGRAAFALHLLHDGDVAPDVRDAPRRPLIGEFGHGGGRGDRIDRADLVHPVGDMGDRGVAVHRRMVLDMGLPSVVAAWLPSRLTLRRQPGPTSGCGFRHHLDGVAGALLEAGRAAGAQSFVQPVAGPVQLDDRLLRTGARSSCRTRSRRRSSGSAAPHAAPTGSVRPREDLGETREPVCVVQSLLRRGIDVAEHRQMQHLESGPPAA